VDETERGRGEIVGEDRHRAAYWKSWPQGRKAVAGPTPGAPADQTEFSEGIQLAAQLGVTGARHAYRGASIIAVGRVSSAFTARPCRRRLRVPDK